jgi:hypothetical protein
MAPETPESIQRNTPQSHPIPEVDEGLKALRYEETLLAKPPIAVTVPPPQALPFDTIPVLRISAADTEQQDELKRDSGLAPTESTGVRESSLAAGDEGSSTAFTNGGVIPGTPSSPKITKSDSSSTASRWKLGGTMNGSRPKTPRTPKTPQSRGSKAMSSDTEFSPITTPIPSESQLDLDFMDQISFSKRGSVLLGGRKAVSGRARENTGKRYVI